MTAASVRTESFRRLSDAPVSGKRALVRVDFNVPMQDRKVTDDTRIKAALPTITFLRDAGAKTILIAHFDRPKGERRPDMSLSPVAAALERLLGAPVKFIDDCVGDAVGAAVDAMEPGDVVLLENTRFHKGEEANEREFASALAAHADLYVNDAFSAAHRAHASTEGVAHDLPAYAGLALARELDYLAAALAAPIRPVLAIVGGAKVSTKIAVLKNLAAKVDMLAIGGAMANTFLLAKGHEVGASLVEGDQLDVARDIEAACEAAGCRLILPVDGVAAAKFEAHAPHANVPIDAVPGDQMILDIGSGSADRIADAIEAARTVVWNGPVGAFEIPPFDTSTVEIAKFIAKRTREADLVSVAGGGDTVAAVNHAGVGEELTFVSTAGGAFLEWMEGRALPGVEALKA